MALSKTIANEVANFDRKKLKSTKSESEEDAFTDYITDLRKSVISEVEQFQSANLSPRKTIEKESIHSLCFDFLSLRTNHGSQVLCDPQGSCESLSIFILLELFI